MGVQDSSQFDGRAYLDEGTNPHKQNIRPPNAWCRVIVNIGKQNHGQNLREIAREIWLMRSQVTCDYGDPKPGEKQSQTTSFLEGLSWFLGWIWTDWPDICGTKLVAKFHCVFYFPMKPVGRLNFVFSLGWQPRNHQFFALPLVTHNNQPLQ